MYRGPYEFWNTFSNLWRFVVMYTSPILWHTAHDKYVVQNCEYWHPLQDFWDTSLGITFLLVRLQTSVTEFDFGRLISNLISNSWWLRATHGLMAWQPVMWRSVRFPWRSGDHGTGQESEFCDAVYTNFTSNWTPQHFDDVSCFCKQSEHLVHRKEPHTG